MSQPFGYTILPGPPTAPPPDGYVYAPNAQGQWTSRPVSGQDNSTLSTANVPGYTATPNTQAIGGTSSAWDDPLGLRKYLPAWANPDMGGGIDARPAEKAVAGTASLLDIVTNLPRMAAIVVGLILLIAGLFMLGVSPAVNIVGNVRDKTGI